jgi:Survival motor neuron (SMN) interacting protein 1 (SIP1)
MHLLMYFTHWINTHVNQPEQPSSQITETHARWIFALLSCIESDISANDMSLLRCLARAAITLLKYLTKQRSQMKNVSSIQGGDDLGRQGDCGLMRESSCWMVICAVVGVWGQHDLWMEAEAMLAGL